ncbi:MAG: thioredoxin family protein [Akkermansia sp.]|nr:thioredoxin family protein [Akkermansia sp.]
MNRCISLLLTTLAPLLLVSCGDSDEEKRERAAQFTTPTKPAPNPQRESLQALIRTDRQVPTTLNGGPRFELYSVYEGQDMRQVTEVSGRTLLLCFTAPWCRHSTAMRNALKELAEKEKGGIQVVEIDADAYPALANDYDLTKVPTTVFYAEGIKLRSVEGAFTADDLRRYLHNLLTQEEETSQEP